jgi:hypothetical protein
MKRITIVLGVMAVMVVMLVALAAPAMAKPNNGNNNHNKGPRHGMVHKKLNHPLRPHGGSFVGRPFNHVINPGFRPVI